MGSLSLSLSLSFFLFLSTIAATITAEKPSGPTKSTNQHYKNLSPLLLLFMLVVYTWHKALTPTYSTKHWSYEPSRLNAGNISLSLSLTHTHARTHTHTHTLAATIEQLLG